MSEYALGLIETSGLVAAIEAADAASKAAAVVVASAELTDATYMTLRIEGELGAVQAAVEAGARAAEAVGEVVAVHVIPNPDDGIEIVTPNRRYTSKYHPNEKRPPLSPEAKSPSRKATPSRRPKRSSPKVARAETTQPPVDLTGLSVAELRRTARSLTRLHLKGREISLANKKQLIDAIKRVMDMD
jgi:microcompartment protein CcmL/EutN